MISMAIPDKNFGGGKIDGSGSVYGVESCKIGQTDRQTDNIMMPILHTPNQGIDRLYIHLHSSKSTAKNKTNKQTNKQTNEQTNIYKQNTKIAMKST